MAARKVLLIEDNAGAREGLGRLLADDGHQVRTARTGESGLRCLERFHPDVVICDFTLPGMDGLQVLRRAKELHRGLTFIILTSGARSCEIEDALRAEADVFLKKPVTPALINALLAISAAERQPAAPGVPN